MKMLSVRKSVQNVEELQELFRSLEGLRKKFQPGQYRITIERVELQRTDLQNRYYWAILNDIAEQTGNDADDLHEHFKARFLQDRSRRPARIMSTTELDVRQVINYIDKIISFVGSELGITVQTPREF